MHCQKKAMLHKLLKATITHKLAEKQDEIVAKNKEQKRTAWIKEWLDEQFRATLNDQILHTDKERFVFAFCMEPAMLDGLLQKVKVYIERQDTPMRQAISAQTRLMLTLHFLATGASVSLLSELFRVSVSAIAKIIPDVCQAIWAVLGPEFIKLPSTAREWEEKAQEFSSRWNHPRALAAIDGKHVAVQAFGNSASAFYNYKKYFSIVLMAVADAKYFFIYTDIGSPGSCNDSGIFERSHFKTSLKAGALNLPGMPMDNLQCDFHFLSDDAFALGTRMMKPYPNSSLAQMERVYNYRHSRARRVVENAFGILSSRFRVLRRPLLQSYTNAVKTVQAACVLHNFLLQNYAVPPVEAEINRDRTEFEETSAAIQKFQGSTDLVDAQSQRRRMAEFFFTHGQKGFQWRNTFKLRTDPAE